MTIMERCAVGLVVLTLVFTFCTFISWFTCNLGDFYPSTCAVTMSGTVHNEIEFLVKLARNLFR